MKSEPDNRLEELALPSLGKRLVGWLGTYFFGSALIPIFLSIVSWCLAGGSVSFAELIHMALAIFGIFPIGLSAPLFFVLPESWIGQTLVLSLVALAYFFYLVHLGFTLTAKTQRRVRSLSIILGGMICFNLAGFIILMMLGSAIRSAASL